LKDTQKTKKWIFPAVGAAVVLLTVAALSIFWANNAPETVDNAESQVENVTPAQEEPNTTDPDEQEILSFLEGLAKTDSIPALGDVVSEDGITNILIIGTDERTEEFSDDARGDVCMLWSMNRQTGAISLVSFERGTGVPILSGEYQGQWDWLTHTFRYGGAQLMMQEIEECYKIEVSHYLRFNFYGFITVLDTVGGVDIELSGAEAEYLNQCRTAERENLPALTAGVNHLDGEDALQYARMRATDSDWTRVERQRKVMVATMKQIKSMGITELLTLPGTVMPLVQTNLTEGDFFSLMLMTPQMYQAQLQQETIPLRGTYGSMVGMGGRSLFAVDFDTNAKYLHKMLYGKEE